MAARRKPKRVFEGPVYWTRLERRGAALLPEGPFGTEKAARDRGHMRLELEPIAVRAWCRSVLSVSDVDRKGRVGERRDVEEYVYEDLAPPSARNRKFGFVTRAIGP